MDSKEKMNQMEMSSLSGESPSEKKKKPRGCFASWLCTPVTFLVVLLLSTILKATATGYSSGVITSLEKRFQLKSTQIGYISMVEDIVGLFTVMIIVHYGQSRHRPRVIGVLTILVAVGVLLQAMPHFLYKLPTALLTSVPSIVTEKNVTEAADSLFCYADGEREPRECTAEEDASSGSLMHEAFWIPLGSSVISLGSGIGAISLTYLDDNVPRRTMPIYAGIVFSVFVFGSLFGFFLASFCLQFPVTFPFYNPESYSASPGDANWLGAWWLGYIICSFLLALFGLLFFLFPRQLRDPEELARENEEYMKANPLPAKKKAKDEEETEKSEAGCENGPVEFIKDFLHALLEIAKNTVVMSLIIAGCLTAFSATGFMIFGPKFFSVVYELDPSVSALVMGAFLIPGAVTGQILGGVIINRLNLSRYGMALMLIVTTVLMMCGCGLFYVLRCDKRAVAGITVPYDSGNVIQYNFTRSSLTALSHDCNDGCDCPEGIYQPVCGDDLVTYVTPCHAGCTDINTDDGNVTYTGCSCIVNSDGSLGTARPQQCERPCSIWVFYILVMIPSTLLGTMAGIAGFMLQLRSVDEHHRGLAMSAANVLVKILGYIPGPVFFGFVIESTCELYQALCGKTGNCVIYNSDSFLVGFNSVMLGAQSIGFICVIIAFLAVRRQTPKALRGFRALPSSEDELASNA
ncbi:solute carrier organic anion transporter family member 3A1-like [Apostichopus japonicus]|uniref:solute carrier organic anion transporter family member 3A1-like n=1 Tax=Stichopus japonicus TaxID=307972 RepID=UPI003AB51BB0